MTFIVNAIHNSGENSEGTTITGSSKFVLELASASEALQLKASAYQMQLRCANRTAQNHRIKEGHCSCQCAWAMNTLTDTAPHSLPLMRKCMAWSSMVGIRSGYGQLVSWSQCLTRYK